MSPALRAEHAAGRGWLVGVATGMIALPLLWQGPSDFWMGVGLTGVVASALMTSFRLGQWTVARRLRLQIGIPVIPPSHPDTPTEGSDAPALRALSSLEEARNMGWVFSGVAAILGNAPVPRYATWGSQRYEYAGLVADTALPGLQECTFGRVVYRLMVKEGSPVPPEGTPGSVSWGS